MMYLGMTSLAKSQGVGPGFVLLLTSLPYPKHRGPKNGSAERSTELRLRAHGNPVWAAPTAVSICRREAPQQVADSGEFKNLDYPSSMGFESKATNSLTAFSTSLWSTISEGVCT